MMIWSTRSTVIAALAAKVMPQNFPANVSVMLAAPASFTPGPSACVRVRNKHLLKLNSTNLDVDADKLLALLVSAVEKRHNLGAL